MVDVRAPMLVFVLGCLLLRAARPQAGTVTLILAAAALLLGAAVGEVMLDRLGVPSGSAEAGALYWPAQPQ